MSSDTLLSLVLRTHKARSLNDFDSYLHLRQQLVRELDKLQDIFDKKYQASDEIYCRYLGMNERGRSQ